MKTTAFVRNYLLALLLFNLSACAAMHSVDVESAMRSPPPAGIGVGSLVKIKTLDHQRFRFRVTHATNAGLDGEYGFIAYADMAQLKVDGAARNEGHMATYILDLLGVAALIALLGSADHVSFCSQPPCTE